jgi:uncharacterized membrane protein YfcA
MEAAVAVPPRLPTHAGQAPAAATPPFPTLTPEQLQQRAEARQLGKKVRRAIRTATFSSWTIAIFAGLTTLSSLFDPAGLVLGLGMCAVAWYEFRGAAQLRRLDPEAPRLLARNQIYLGILLFAYAAWGLYHALSGPAFGMDPALAADPALSAAMKPFEGLARMISISVYVTLALVAIFAQGGTAWYYASRAKYIRHYVQNTPAWILQMQRAGVGV